MATPGCCREARCSPGTRGRPRPANLVARVQASSGLKRLLQWAADAKASAQTQEACLIRLAIATRCSTSVSNTGHCRTAGPGRDRSAVNVWRVTSHPTLAACFVSETDRGYCWPWLCARDTLPTLPIGVPVRWSMKVCVVGRSLTIQPVACATSGLLERLGKRTLPVLLPRC